MDINKLQHTCLSVFLDHISAIFWRFCLMNRERENVLHKHCSKMIVYQMNILFMTSGCQIVLWYYRLCWVSMEALRKWEERASASCVCFRQKHKATWFPLFAKHLTFFLWALQNGGNISSSKIVWTLPVSHWAFILVWTGFKGALYPKPKKYCLERSL